MFSIHRVVSGGEIDGEKEMIVRREDAQERSPFLVGETKVLSLVEKKKEKRFRPLKKVRPRIKSRKNKRIIS